MSAAASTTDHQRSRNRPTNRPDVVDVDRRRQGRPTVNRDSSRSGSSRSMALFVLAELVLAMAIPFLAIEGYHTLLGSRTGTFVEQVSDAEPGWFALVDHTPVTMVVEVHAGSVTGLAVVAEPSTVMLAGASTVVDGRALSDRQPTEAGLALAEALRLGVDTIEIMDAAAWRDLLGTTAYLIDNPDPVPAGDGTTLVDVGVVEVGAEEVTAVLGVPAIAGQPRSVLPRRRLFWEAIATTPPAGSSLPEAQADGQGNGSEQSAGGLADRNSGLLEVLQRLEAPVSIQDLTVVDDGTVALDATSAEALIRNVVAYPTSPPSGARLRLELVDRTGTADLRSVAAVLAGRGIEVVSIANAAAFDGGPSQLLVPPPLDPSAPTSQPGPGSAGAVADLVDLSASLGIATVVEVESVEETGEAPAVRLVIGSDFDPTRLS